jgi:hypothetical protein
MTNMYLEEEQCQIVEKCSGFDLLTFGVGRFRSLRSQPPASFMMGVGSTDIQSRYVSTYRTL